VYEHDRGADAGDPVPDWLAVELELRQLHRLSVSAPPHRSTVRARSADCDANRPFGMIRLHPPICRICVEPRVNAYRLASTIVVAAAVAAVAAGCGSSASAEENWAGDVCSAVTDWKTSVQQATKDISTKLQSPETGMLTAIQTDVRTAVDATSKLASDLKSLTPPDTDAGKKAQQEVDALANQLQSTAQTAKQTTANVPKSATTSETVQALAPLAPALQSLAAKTSSTLTAVQNTGQALKDGFDKADSCKPYRS
jgi:hypothetical protein